MTETKKQRRLNSLYEKLGKIEEREMFCVEAGLHTKLASIRFEMVPIKQQINLIEGCDIYPEAAVN